MCSLIWQVVLSLLSESRDPLVREHGSWLDAPNGHPVYATSDWTGGTYAPASAGADEASGAAPKGVAPKGGESQ